MKHSSQFKISKTIYCLPHVQEKKHCDVFNAMIDLTVRLRITWTSRHRPDEDKLCSLRGSDETRCGTGFIRFVCSSVCDELCPCVQCDGKIRNSFLKFTVQTAQHVVYNTEEARAAMVDLFYDDDSCRWDGIMKTVIGLEVVKSKPDRDFSYMLCVTHDKALSERIQSAWRCWWCQWFSFNTTYKFLF
ncbi:hypothetical protein EGW08_001292 [Elysia chlorotica]|uniref:Uncharacterized protein n=1 Tax=Elysia chlorotica TaxID=188477 RepID=A0A3S1A584_ELYCH|nr:hypothetical protein EGW08_001292 [Elysia chlorotica]